MNVGEVELINFTTHDKTKLVLPKTGILLVTGENGAGKSSFVEGVAYAGWGKTLRGSVPWRGDAKPPCTARIDTDHLRITRTRKGAKTELDWEDWEMNAQDVPGASSGDADVYDTPTKAQAALVHMLGPFDLWRRSHVFSSADATHFTTATDSERKRLIETFLGNDRFDPALEKCRADLKAAREREATLVRQRDVATAKLNGATQRREDARKQIDALVEPPPPPEPKEGKELKDFDEKLTGLRRDVARLRDGARTLDRAGGEHEATAKLAKQMLARLAADKCPTCERPITPDMRRVEKVKADKADTLAKEAREEAEKQRGDIDAALTQAEEAIQHFQAERDARSAELAVVRHAQGERVRYEATLKSLIDTFQGALADVAKLKTELVETEDALDEVSQDIAELSAVEIVLGVKGVRAHILGKSLSGIEAIANVWLAKLRRSDMRVALKPYSELKSKDGVDDSISFEVEGVGGGLGYKASSGGERRRLDVAMLFAMAEVSSAARGLAAGTLWFDEVFDCLDDTGVDAVTDALRELSETRCVVVITHSASLIAKLPDARKVRVAHGRIEV